MEDHRVFRQSIVMPDSSHPFRDSSSVCAAFGRSVPGNEADPSLVDVVKRIVRRILRTQCRRTNFQARVLEEARRLRDHHGSALPGEAFEHLIVDRLLCACGDSRFNPVGQDASPACPSTWGRVFEMTFAGQAAGR
jgi:hypothetical protein